jgi:HD-GYP domain-containing protein (c-di-GMP phosphodiesterase class II)
MSKETIQSIALSVSCGWETLRNMEEDMNEVFKKAESDMYQRKLSDRTRMRHEAIQVIIQTLHNKAPAEEEHANRVSQLCEKLGVALDFTDGDIRELEMTGRLHDIGKITMIDIVNKEGQLNRPEWLEIKRHPEVGYSIASAVNEYAPLAEYILAHHERWDGTGYPKGLIGAEIPLQARILMITEAYAAMTADQPHRKALEKQKVVEMMEEEAGKQFDPDLLKVFLERVMEESELE